MSERPTPSDLYRFDRTLSLCHAIALQAKEATGLAVDDPALAARLFAMQREASSIASLCRDRIVDERREIDAELARQRDEQEQERRRRLAESKRRRQDESGDYPTSSRD